MVTVQLDLSTTLLALSITFAAIVHLLSALGYLKRPQEPPASLQGQPSPQAPALTPPPGWGQPGFGWSAAPPPMPRPSSGELLGRTKRRTRTMTEDEGPDPAVTDNLQMGEVASMEDIVKRRFAVHSARSLQTPSEVLQLLKTGNARFWTGQAKRPELNAMERRALILQQAPSVAVIGCADSRVPIEIVFDQGLGDMFVIRVAGNVYGDGQTVGGSLDYAIHHLHVKLVVVLGHEGCGAVKAAQLPKEDIVKEAPKLQGLLNGMKVDLEGSKGVLSSIGDNRARDREAVSVNTRMQVAKIKAEPLIAKKEAAGDLMIVGAFYEITSGLVDFYDADAQVGKQTEEDTAGETDEELAGVTPSTSNDDLTTQLKTPLSPAQLKMRSLLNMHKDVESISG